MLKETFADLGAAPLSNSYIAAAGLGEPEIYYPLHVRVCTECFLVQLEEFAAPEAIFSDYAYLSSYSDSWLEHCRRYANDVIANNELGPRSLVAEVASNDGYLLQYFHERGIPVLGIEPAKNAARIGIERGIRAETLFFGEQTARYLLDKYGNADLLIANNVLAHVPLIHDFVEGIAILLAAGGRASLEFPHLLNLIESTQFDTIYHEHFSYLSLTALIPIFAAHRLRVIDVEGVDTHGGSLRVWAAHDGSGFTTTSSVAQMLQLERERGLSSLAVYKAFQGQILRVKSEFVSFLLQAQAQGKTVAGYGAAAKGNTLLNYCGVRPDLVEFVVDRNPLKQGRYLPGSRIPVRSPAHVERAKPDYLIILPWNIKAEIVEQMRIVRTWGCQFVTAVPKLHID